MFGHGSGDPWKDDDRVLRWK
ncbi:hypothetical protein IL54_2083 [Sphingobium sp. ba1]|nr:hypothetical protein IL54_2083 [Sphingobium sp. ba1]